MTYVPIAVMVCQLITTLYPTFNYPGIMSREVAVEMTDPSLHTTGKIGAYYERRTPVDTGHGFAFYLAESGPCIKAPGYFSNEHRI